MWERTITLLFGEKWRTGIISHFSFFLWFKPDQAQIGAEEETTFMQFKTILITEGEIKTKI